MDTIAPASDQPVATGAQPRGLFDPEQPLDLPLELVEREVDRERLALDVGRREQRRHHDEMTDP